MAPVRCQAITRTNDDTVFWSINASLPLNELTLNCKCLKRIVSWKYKDAFVLISLSSLSCLYRLVAQGARASVVTNLPATMSCPPKGLRCMQNFSYNQFMDLWNPNWYDYLGNAPAHAMLNIPIAFWLTVLHHPSIRSSSLQYFKRSAAMTTPHGRGMNS